MKANELRIGNKLILNDTGEKFTVTGIMQDSHGVKVYGITDNGTYCNTWIEHCRPIPITEDCLLNIGFELTYVSKYRVKFDHSIHNEIGFDFCFDSDHSMSGFRYYGNRINSIGYVHQLQNTHFALTGEELTIQQL